MTTKPAIRKTVVLEATLTDCPEEVREEIFKLWQEMDFGNDYYYYPWRVDFEDDFTYPAIHSYLQAQGITECLIHFWW